MRRLFRLFWRRRYDWREGKRGYREEVKQREGKTGAMGRFVYCNNNNIYSEQLVLVNASHPYIEEETKEGLYPVHPQAPEILLKEQAVIHLSALMEEIKGWEWIVPVSGWRSLREQQDIFDSSLKEKGEEFTRKFVALPGCSEHQTGLAIDLGLKQEKVDFICPDFPYEGICQRFRERAAAYGFIERYQKAKEEITGISQEPWHFRYVGTPHAERMKKYGVCLEEYIEMLGRLSHGRRYDGAGR